MRHLLGCRVVELVLPRACEAVLDSAVGPQTPHDPGQLLWQSGLLLGLRTQDKHLARVLLEGAQTQQPLEEEEEEDGGEEEEKGEEVFWVYEKMEVNSSQFKSVNYSPVSEGMYQRAAHKIKQ